MVTSKRTVKVADHAAKKNFRKDYKYVYHATPAGTGRLTGHKKR